MYHRIMGPGVFVVLLDVDRNLISTYSFTLNMLPSVTVHVYINMNLFETIMLLCIVSLVVRCYLGN